MNIQKIDINLLKPAEYNPRKKLKKSDKEYIKIKNSIEKFGYIDPIILNKDFTVIGGHQRLTVLKDLKYKEIDCVIVDISKEEEKALNIGLNKISGDWDKDLLKDLFLDLKLTDIDLNLTGFDDVEISELIGEELKAEEDDFEVPNENEIKTDIVLGDLFEIGEHRLLCGDSTQTDTFEKLMQGEQADMVVTDPPYNVALGVETKEQAKARNRRTDGLVIQNDKMSNTDFYKFLYDFYSALSTAVKKGGSIYVWYASSEVVNFVSAMVDSGWLYKQELIWNKTSMIMGRQDYQWKHEPCLYGWKDGAAHNWYSDRKQTTVINFDKPQRSGEHPTMKPIGLFAYQIENSSKVGDIVIDAFGGSGTTMVACEQLKRKARLIEFDPKYCQVIIDRMRKLDPTLVIKKNGVII